MRQAAEQSGSDQRNTPRVALLMRPAKLLMAAGEFLCVIRDLSETGIKVRLLHPLAADQQLTVEFQTGTKIEMETIWQRGAEAGFRFSTPLDLVKEIKGIGEYPKRPIRLSLRVPITVSAGGLLTNAAMLNLSNHGARIECGARRFAIGELVRIETRGLPFVRAKVRWRREDTYGLVFVDTFSLGDLARYTAALQLRGPARRNEPLLHPTSTRPLQIRQAP